MMKAELYLTQKCKTMLGHPKYRHKEEKKKMLKMSFKKLQKMEDPESLLCKAVLINNTLKYLQNKGVMVNNNNTEDREDNIDDKTTTMDYNDTSDQKKEFYNKDITQYSTDKLLMNNCDEKQDIKYEETKEQKEIIDMCDDNLVDTDTKERNESNKDNSSSEPNVCALISDSSSCPTSYHITC